MYEDKLQLNLHDVVEIIGVFEGGMCRNDVDLGVEVDLGDLHLADQHDNPVRL